MRLNKTDRDYLQWCLKGGYKVYAFTREKCFTISVAPPIYEKVAFKIKPKKTCN